jgi:dimeric dUTPase (all-alpha-NTP-PPase superfamily)
MLGKSSTYNAPKQYDEELENLTSHYNRIHSRRGWINKDLDSPIKKSIAAIWFVLMAAYNDIYDSETGNREFNKFQFLKNCKQVNEQISMIDWTKGEISKDQIEHVALWITDVKEFLKELIHYAKKHSLELADLGTPQSSNEKPPTRLDSETPEDERRSINPLVDASPRSPTVKASPKLRRTVRAPPPRIKRASVKAPVPVPEHVPEPVAPRKVSSPRPTPRGRISVKAPVPKPLEAPRKVSSPRPTPRGRPVKASVRRSHTRRYWKDDPLHESNLKMKSTVSRNAVKPVIQESPKPDLSVVCAESGECLALGQYHKELIQLFDFPSFRNVIAIRELSSGENGDVFGLKYELNDFNPPYISYAAIKTSKNPKADNLLYEYIVGMHFINNISLQFPVFVSTYGIYQKIKFLTDVSEIVESLRPLGEDFPTACAKSKYLSILTQYINGAPLNKYLSLPKFNTRHLTNMLYMIYQALSSMSKQFTHYDLHAGNVIIIKLSGAIEYVYHDEGVTFRSAYIPKIIDYGRSFFDNGTLSSRDIYEKVCQECHNCGRDVGFTYFNYPGLHWHVDSYAKNESHDLRLLYRISISNIVLESPLKEILDTVVYGKGLLRRQKPHQGTIENLGHEPSRILNIHDAKDRLEKIITPNIDLYPNIMGRLTIYKDRPMEFVRV